MMNQRQEHSAIELHDSALASVNQVGEGIEIALVPGYIHKSIGACGVDPGTVWLQDILITLEGASLEGQLPEMPCDLSGGALMITGQHISENMLALPLDQSGNITLRLDIMWGGGQLFFRGRRILALPKGEAKYLEDFK
jgi:hypothetical protein